MAKGYRDTGDPEIAPDEFQQARPGAHVITGIESWVSVDDKGFPLFKEYNNQLKVLVRLSSTGEDIGPTLSLTPAELFAFASAFGVTSAANKSARTSTETLIALKDAINNSGKKVKVEVNDKGWARLPDSAQPPAGLYSVKFSTMHRKDHEEGNLNFQVDDKGASLMVEFEIAGDAQGKPCQYDGWTILWWAPNVFVDSYLDHGEVVRAEVLTFDRTPAGGVPKNALRWRNFADHFAPGWMEHDWKRDPLQSQFGVDEVFSPAYVLNYYAEQSGTPVVVWTTYNKNGRLVFDLFDGVHGAATPEPALLERVVKYLSAVADVDLYSKVALPDVLILTDDGKEWMRQYVAGDGGPWVRAEMPEHNSLLKLTEEELGRLFEELKAQFGEGGF